MRTGNLILPQIRMHWIGVATGVTSVCSANESVIRAAIVNAKKQNRVALIESTSNQVDQFGGYTGMTPNQFRDLVAGIASEVDYPMSKVALGGDHLGPNVWRNEPSGQAMPKAEELVRSYVKAGYSKIHLDASIRCVDDVHREDEAWPKVVAERTAFLARAAEDEFNKDGADPERPVYVIGSDVPVPGGELQEKNVVETTSAEDLERTIILTREAFSRVGLERIWDRVIAVVVQPGVEFGPEWVKDYQRGKAARLKETIEGDDDLVYEAHSTDFQLKESLREMVEDHFAILKVGPWLTFAFREAIFALEIIESELFGKKSSAGISNLSNVIDARMNEVPGYWSGYYHDIDEQHLSFERHFSLSDRIRYYWSDTQVKAALGKLMHNLSSVEIPISLVSQFFPESFETSRVSGTANIAQRLITNRILMVLDKYNYATTGANS